MNKRKIPERFLVRLLFLVAGMFLIAFGVAVSTKSGLGVSPSASIPYVLCRVTPLSMGTITTIINCLMVLVQIILLRRDYKIFQLLQLLVVFGFGYFTDLTLWMVEGFEVTSYPLQLLCCVVSCLIMALGLFLEVKANLITMSSEGAINAVVKVFHTDFGKTKIGLDCTLVIIGCILSLIYFHTIIGVREGTIIAAILVGLCIQFYNKWFAFVDRLVCVSVESAAGLQTMDNAPFVITIEREFATGGHEIGEKIAKALGIKFYNQELIVKAAEEAGYTTEDVAHNEEKLPNGLIYSLYNQSFAASNNISKQDAIFKAQSQIIKDFASKESCVIVGRLSSYVLGDRPNCFHVFVSGDYEFRADRVMEKSGMDRKKALDLVKKEDQARAAYCHHFTGAPWGIARHYALSVDSSKYGIEDSTQIILDAIDKYRAS